MNILLESYVLTFGVFFTESIVYCIYRVYLSIKEEVILENFNLRMIKRSRKMQSNVPLLFNSLKFIVVLCFAEALHIDLEPSPMPISLGQNQSSKMLTDGRGGTQTLKICSCSIFVEMIHSLHPFTIIFGLAMLYLPIYIYLTTSITTITTMLHHSLVLLLNNRKTLVMPLNMSQIGLEFQIIANVLYYKRSYCQIRFERLVLRIIQTFVGSIIPKTGICVSIMLLV
jgi:hypothetical protein